MKIFKYILDGAGSISEVEMPVGAEILHVGMQGNDICLWVKVDPTQETINRKFRVYGTGWPLNDQKYLGTVQESPFVWHVFEVENQ